MSVDLRHSRNAEQTKRMQQAKMDNVCPFCKENIERIHGLPITHHQYWMVTDNAFPYEGTAVHKLLIYRPEHIEHLSEIPAAAWEELESIAGKSTRDMAGGAFFIRFGDTAKTGSSISHLHAHILAGTGDANDSKFKQEPLKVRLGYKKINPGA